MRVDRTGRIRVLRAGPDRQGPVVYWMSRDQRSEDNWALLHASQVAKAKRCGLIVAFCLAPEFLGAAWRQYHFMLEGLRELESRLRSKGIAFVLLHGLPEIMLP